MREMKDSGIEWINSIPKSWELMKIKYILREHIEKNYPIKTKRSALMFRDIKALSTGRE